MDTMATSDFNIVIDSREATVISLLQGKVHFATQNLDVGDIIIKDGETPVAIIERKTLRDLASSIKDGRYKEQKLRLLSYKLQYPSCLTVLMVEGVWAFDDDNLFENMPSKSINTVLFNNIFSKEINVIQTHDCHATVASILGMFKRCKDNQLGEKTVQPSAEYHQDALIKQKKKDNCGPDSCLIFQLSCIPNISVKKARQICTTLQCSNMLELYDKLISPEKAVSTLLAVDGIGKKLATTLVSYIYHTN
jgi:ERCC4-type nuclease